MNPGEHLMAFWDDENMATLRGCGQCMQWCKRNSLCVRASGTSREDQGVEPSRSPSRRLHLIGADCPTTPKLWCGVVPILPDLDKKMVLATLGIGHSWFGQTWFWPNGQSWP